MHGDFHPRNVAVTARGLLIFDWTDGAVAHPFTDLQPLASEGTIEPSVRGAYLAAWSGVAPPDALAEAFELARKLGYAYHTVSYPRIFAGQEPASRHELLGGLRHYAGRLVEVVNADR